MYTKDIQTRRENKKKLTEVIQHLHWNQEVSRIYVGGLAELNGQPTPVCHFGAFTSINKHHDITINERIVDYRIVGYL